MTTGQVARALAGPAAVNSGWRPLVVFVVLTFCLTWAVWLPRAAGVNVGVLEQLSTWMPAVAAVLTAALVAGRQGVRELGGRLFRWRVAWWWYVIPRYGQNLLPEIEQAVNSSAVSADRERGW